MDYHFIDIEDIYFPKENAEYMYSDPRSFEEVETILSNIISENDNLILASVTGNFKEEIVSHFTCAIYIDVSKKIRIKRVYERSYTKFGERMCAGGDLYEKEQSFFDFVMSRDEDTFKNWLDTISCPIIKVDGTLPIADNVKSITEKLRDKKIVELY